MSFKSGSGTIKIGRTEFLIRIKMHSNIITKTVKHKLNFSTLRLLALFKIHKILIPVKYENLNIDFSLVEDDSEKSIEEETEEDEVESSKEENNVKFKKNISRYL